MQLTMRNDNVLIKIVRRAENKDIILPDTLKEDDNITKAKFVIEDFNELCEANLGLSRNKQIYFSPFAARTKIDAEHFIIKQEDIIAIAENDFEM